MAMTDKEQAFLDYMFSHGNNCACNLIDIITRQIDEENPEDMLNKLRAMNFYNGYLDACSTFIEGYKHMFGE